MRRIASEDDSLFQSYHLLVAEVFIYPKLGKELDLLPFIMKTTNKEENLVVVLVQHQHKKSLHAAMIIRGNTSSTMAVMHRPTVP